jgi:hypothetical protein
MKELLYIPSGKIFRFYSSASIGLGAPSVSIEHFLNTEEGQDDAPGGDVKDIIALIIDRVYTEELYTFAEIPSDISLCEEEFELVDI